MPANAKADSVQIEFYDGALVGLYWPPDADLGDAYPISAELLNRVVRELGFCVGRKAARREPHLVDLEEILAGNDDASSALSSKSPSSPANVKEDETIASLQRRLHGERRERALAIVKEGVLSALRRERKKKKSTRRREKGEGDGTRRPHPRERRERPRGAGEIPRGAGERPRGAGERPRGAGERPRGAGERPRPPPQRSGRQAASSPGRRVFSPTSPSKQAVTSNALSVADRARRNEAMAARLRRKQFAHMVQVEIDNARQHREQMRVQMESENRDATAEREARERLAQQRREKDWLRAEVK